MGSDIAQFLKNNFLDNVEEIEHGLLSPLTSLLNDIRKEFTENDKEGFWSPPPAESLSCFYQLDYVLAECRAYKLQKGALKRTFSRVCCHGPEHKLKTHLSTIKGNLSKVKEENANVSLSPFTASIFPTGRHTSYESPKASSYIPGLHDKDRNKIIEWLSLNDRFRAIGIYGMYGTGKTTLVREVLDDPRVKSKYAKPIWVCLSDLTSKKEMDIRIVKQMLACLKDDPDKLIEEPEDDWLVNRLHSKLKAQKLKYLVVLDDVWHCNDWFCDLWNRADDRILFSHALPKDIGGAVIVTSRLKEVTVQLVRKSNLFHLVALDEEEMKNFVRKCKEIQDDNTLDEIVYHCHGLPLVAKTLSDWIAKQIPGGQAGSV